MCLSNWQDLKMLINSRLGTHVGRQVLMDTAMERGRLPVQKKQLNGYDASVVC